MPHKGGRSRSQRSLVEGASTDRARLDPEFGHAILPLYLPKRGATNTNHLILWPIDL